MRRDEIERCRSSIFNSKGGIAHYLTQVNYLPEET